MALQHFYSRVPARVSMYKRADGFDTFAHSAGLDREFIEKELAPCFENKLNKVDPALIRGGKVSPVYCQHRTRDGQVVHSCVRYLALDYTAERSAYLAHSLVLQEEECSKLFSAINGSGLNTSVFAKDIEKFSLTAPTATPNSKYPALPYRVLEAEDPMLVLGKFNEETVKAFLLAVLLNICGKGKTVYFKLPAEDTVLSETALRFLTAISSVIPCHLRSNLSYVTYVTDPAQYPSAKIKCVSDLASEIPSGKGIFFDFHTNIVAGFKEADLTTNRQLSNFLYLALKDAALRQAFLQYINNAVNAMPNLRSTSMKMLNDLVFLFGQCSGFFPEASVLPNDAKVYEFICVYDSYRDALKEEHREAAFKCFQRYPQQHIPIPKNTFAKFSKLYPTEVPSARKIMMDVVLDLIHTDIMRDKLFVFIRNNYAAEKDEVRRIINEDLSRVYYGGFLQPQLLSFFAQNFATEPEDTQNLILDKLLLTIRTPAVQPKILAFLEENYSQFSDVQKRQFYATFYEMLPECDNLAKLLVELVNKLIISEGVSFRKETADSICQLLQIDQRKQEPKMLPVLTAQKGFCSDIVVSLIFGAWSGRKIRKEYIEHLEGMGFGDLIAEVVYIFGIAADMEETVAKNLSATVGNRLLSYSASTNLYDWLQADAQIVTGLRSHEQLRAQQWGAYLRQQFTIPEICNRLYDAFDTNLRKNGVDIVAKYSQEVPQIRQCTQFQTITAFYALTDALIAEDGTAACNSICSIPQDTALREQISRYLANLQLQSDKAETLRVMCAEYLRSETVSVSGLYQRFSDKYNREFSRDTEKLNPTQISFDSGCAAVSMVLACCLQIALLCPVPADLEAMVNQFLTVNPKKCKKWLLDELARMKQCELVSTCKTIAEDAKIESKGLFAKLFSKK